MPSSAKPKSKSKAAKKQAVNEPTASAPAPHEVEEDDSNDDVEEDEEEDEDSDAEEDVALSDLGSDAEDDEDIDIVPYTKLHKDNHAALTQALSTFALPLTTLPFHIHQSITSPPSTEEIDVNDDLNRELAFYKQALGAVQQGRKRLLAEGVPFSRPTDYFAEMIKDDEHMDKIKERIIAEDASKKASEAAKRQRDLKKFGKTVQVQKLQDRQKEKKSTLEKIKALKKKRQDGNTLTTEDDFDVELDNAVNDGRRGGKTKMTREKRNEKYGFGGNVRKRKRDDSDVWNETGSRGGGGRGGFGGRGRRGKKRGGPQRLGKARRQQQRK